MTMEVLRLVLSTLVLFAAAMVYIAPLRKRQGWELWLLPMALVFAVIMSNSFRLRGAAWVANQLLLGASVVLLVNRCTKISLAADVYCAVWIQVTGSLIHELWMGLLVWQEWSDDPGVYVVSLVLFSAVSYFFLYKTIARWMPDGDLYQIGPRQLGSALLLGSLCILMSQYFLVPQERDKAQATTYLLIQAYCITLLYLQTELFKKSRMEKELEVMHFLYSCEQQYAAACRNINAIEVKCAELEEALAKLPQDVADANREMVDEYGRVRDNALGIQTGNNVLDIVLTEKNLLAQLSHVQINCVADGKLMDFMEVVDIYAIFSNALDNAIEAVQEIQEEHHRLVDVLVHESQNFVVINISNPLTSSLQFEEDLPLTTKKRNRRHGFGLKVLRYAVERYDGMLTVETNGGWFTLKVLIPMRK